MKVGEKKLSPLRSNLYCSSLDVPLNPSNLFVMLVVFMIPYAKLCGKKKRSNRLNSHS